MIAVIDYNMGNLRSVKNALSLLRDDVVFTQKPEDARKADAIIMPGVGAFGDGMKNLEGLGLVPVLTEEVIEKKKPFLGICLGMQLLATEGTEYGIHRGLGWVAGRVVRLEPTLPTCKVPHMGWNELEIKKSGGLFEGIGEHPVCYFVHSYHLVPEEVESSVITATCYHGQEVTAALQKEHIFGVQFHPEKSQGAGLKLLANFFSHVENPAHSLSSLE